MRRKMGRIEEYLFGHALGLFDFIISITISVFLQKQEKQERKYSPISLCFSICWLQKWYFFYRKTILPQFHVAFS